MRPHSTNSKRAAARAKNINRGAISGSVLAEFKNSVFLNGLFMRKIPFLEIPHSELLKLDPRFCKLRLLVGRHLPFNSRTRQRPLAGSTFMSLLLPAAGRHGRTATKMFL
jgi:hypothetical protein